MVQAVVFGREVGGGGAGTGAWRGEAHVHDVDTRKRDASTPIERGRSHVVDRVFEGDLTASAVEHVAAGAGAASDLEIEPPLREPGSLGERASTSDAGSATGATLEWTVAVAIAIAVIVAVAVLRGPGCGVGHVIPDRSPAAISAH